MTKKYRDKGYRSLLTTIVQSSGEQWSDRMTGICHRLVASTNYSLAKGQHTVFQVTCHLTVRNIIDESSTFQLEPTVIRRWTYGSPNSDLICLKKIHTHNCVIIILRIGRLFHHTVDVESTSPSSIYAIHGVQHTHRQFLSQNISLRFGAEIIDETHLRCRCEDMQKFTSAPCCRLNTNCIWRRIYAFK